MVRAFSRRHAEIRQGASETCASSFHASLVPMFKPSSGPKNQPNQHLGLSYQNKPTFGMGDEPWLTPQKNEQVPYQTNWGVNHASSPVHKSLLLGPGDSRQTMQLSPFKTHLHFLRGVVQYRSEVDLVRILGWIVSGSHLANPWYSEICYPLVFGYLTLGELV